VYAAVGVVGMLGGVSLLRSELSRIERNKIENRKSKIEKVGKI
jgi:hypothetical protein